VKPEGKGLLGRPRGRWDDNIKMDLQEVGWGGMGWIDMAQDRDRWWDIVNAVMNFLVPQCAQNFFTGLKRVRFSGRTLLQGVNI
jgi:hypothetical protein